MGEKDLSAFKFIKNKLSSKLHLPADSLGRTYRLQIIGENAILCGCKKILKYKAEEISVLTHDAIITFSGEHMKCICFFDDNIEIRGIFKGVSLERK